jgi:hypothetical protein
VSLVPCHRTVARRERRLQNSGSVTLFAAVLTLSTSSAAAAGPLPPLAPFDVVEAVDHIALPAVPGPVQLEVRALERQVVIEAPRGIRPIAAAISKGLRAVCAEVEVAGAEARLRCRSARIVARIAPRRGGSVLEVAAVRPLPWMGSDAPPLLPFDPKRTGLGEPCPGSTASGRAECLLAQGDRTGARAALSEVVEGSLRPHASLRLGDLDFLEGDLSAAARRWSGVRGLPWERMAAIRLHELSPSRLGAAEYEALYSTDGLPEPMAREVLLRRARGLAFDGRLQDAVNLLEPAACTSVPVCLDILALALRDPGPVSADALAVWADLTDRGTGRAAFEAETAAADVAAREGAPAFAANVLAGAVPRVPEAALPAHLLRTAELFLAADDTVRAEVVLEFARARAGRSVTGPRGAGGARAGAAAEPASPEARAALLHADASAALEAARRATQAAKEITSGGQP